jgi:hypothetical protein
VGRGDADELAEDLARGRRAPEQVLDVAEARQQRRQGAAKAVPGADTEQVLGAGVEVDEGAVGIDDENGSSKAAEDVGRQRCRDWARSGRLAGRPAP